MSSQGNLFANTAEPAIGTPSKKPFAGPPRHFEYRILSDPYGAPDNRGKRAYERFNEKSTKLNPKAKEMFLDLLQTTNADLLSDVIQIGEMWRKCTPLESEDIRMSYGI